MYVERLIGKDTVNTMPHETVLAFADHGVVGDTIEERLPEALAMSSELGKLGVNVDKIVADLQTEGVKKFAESFVALNDSITKKMK